MRAVMYLVSTFIQNDLPSSRCVFQCIKHKQNHHQAIIDAVDPVSLLWISVG